MYKLLGEWISRHWLLTIVGWAALAGAVRWLAPSWDSVTHDGDLAYMPDEMPSVRGEQLLRAAFPENLSKSQMVLICARPEGPLTSDDLRVLERLAQRFGAADEELPINAVWTPWTEVIGKKLVSRDRRAALAVLLLSNEFMAVDNIRVLGVVERIVSEVRAWDDFPTGLRLEISGSAAIGGDMLTSAQESIQNTELATIALVVLILLLVYRAPLLISIPVATIGVSIVVALGLVAALTEANQLPGLGWLDFKVFKTTKIFVVVILFGSGTDFCLFLIARYKEELRQGLDHAAALARAVAAVGDALVGSAMTTILGLGTMVFAAFGKYRNSGPALALCLVVTLAACLTLAPALLRAIGSLVFWPFGGSTSHESAGDDAPAETRFWNVVSRAIVRWPGWILALSCLALAPLAYRGTSVDISYDLTEELRADRASVVGTHLLREYFPAGDTGPITVLAEQPGVNFDSVEGDRMVSQVTKLLYDLPGVASVRSISEPLGNRPGAFNLFSAAGRRKLAVKKHPRTKAIYLAQAPGYAGKVTRLDVITRHDPFSLQSMELLDEIDRRLQKLADDDTSPWFAANFVYAGTTAGVRDLKAVTQSDQALIQRLVVIAVLAVLIVILRRPLTCAYLILTVLFSYLVTMGATQLLFAHLYQPFSGLDWKVPLFLFVILTAIGEDYNIYLMTRVMEEQRTHGLVDGLRLAVVRTGGIITSCGVIMAGTFVSMMFGTLRGILELGFALSLGILLDTLIVRPVLVPAFLTLVYRRRDRLEAAATGAATAGHVRGEWHRQPG